MKVSRNDPCPCGSGRKYKKCCLSEIEARDSSYRRISQTLRSLTGKLMNFVDSALGQDVIDLAFEEFMLDEDFEKLIPLEEVSQPLVEWTLYTWHLTQADINDLEFETPLPADTTVAELYMQKKSAKLDSLELKILQSIGRPAYSFHEVTGILPDSGFSCKDLLTGRTHHVTDHSATKHLEEGDILYCAISTVEGVEILAATSLITFPLSWKTRIIDLRAHMTRNRDGLAEEDLHDFDMDIRQVFLGMYASLLNPPPLANTDGDPVVLHTLHYSIPGPQVAFDALCHLCTVESPEELLKDATFSESGELVTATITWTRVNPAGTSQPDNTILGTIRIDGNGMSIEVNSEKRAQTIGELVEKALGDKARLDSTEVNSLDDFEDMFDEEDDALRGPLQESAHNPLLKETMERMFLEHWRQWADEPIPALNGQTPRQAVTTADGREKVEALLRDAELSQKRGFAFQTGGIDRVRKELGIHSDAGKRT
jgi:hypothetical protein